MTTDVQDMKWQERKADWIRRVADLVGEIEQWCVAEGWSVRRALRHVREDVVGEYDVPQLHIRVPSGGEVYVSPIALHVVGADGRVDVEAWPTLNRVKLLGRDGDWQILTDSNVPLPQRWGRETFFEVVRDLQA